MAAKLLSTRNIVKFRYLINIEFKKLSEQSIQEVQIKYFHIRLQHQKRENGHHKNVLNKIINKTGCPKVYKIDAADP